MQLLQRVRRLRGAADSRNLSRVPLNIRRRLQKAAAAAAIAAAVHARHDPDGGDLQGPVEKPSKAGDEALNGEHQPAAGDAPDGTPESAAAARAASAAPEAKGAAADPGPWRVVVKRRRQWGSEIRRAVRSLAAASYDTQQHDAPLAESPSAATGNAAAAEAEAAAEAQQRCSDACIALEAYAATVGRNAARDAPTAFMCVSSPWEASPGTAPRTRFAKPALHLRIRFRDLLLAAFGYCDTQTFGCGAGRVAEDRQEAGGASEPVTNENAAAI